MFCCIRRFLCMNKGNREIDIKEIELNSLNELIKNSNSYLLIDIRSPAEFKEGHLKGSINLPFYEIYKNSNYLIPQNIDTIIVYCNSGYRSRKVASFLTNKGYKNVYNIKGGIENF